MEKSDSKKQFNKSGIPSDWEVKKLGELQEIEFIETTGRTSGLKYIIHKSKLANVEDEKNYLRLKKQTAFKMKQTILKYLDEFDEINNSTARDILSLIDDDIYKVSRILKQMRDNDEIEITRNDKGITYYAKKN